MAIRKFGDSSSSIPSCVTFWASPFASLRRLATEPGEGQPLSMRPQAQAQRFLSSAWLPSCRQFGLPILATLVTMEVEGSSSTCIHMYVYTSICKIYLNIWNGNEGRKLGQEEKEKRGRRNIHTTEKQNKKQKVRLEGQKHRNHLNFSTLNN